jgi:hypothetical protein
LSKIKFCGKEDCDLLFQNNDFSLVAGTWNGITQFALTENERNAEMQSVPSESSYTVIRNFQQFLDSALSAKRYLVDNDLKTIDQLSNEQINRLIFPGEKHD